MSIFINNEKKSLALIAEKLGCQEYEVKERFINDLHKDHVPMHEKENIINTFQRKKIDESQHLNMDINDTPAALMETWTLEYFENLIKKKSLKPEVPEKYKEDHNKNSRLESLERMSILYKDDTMPKSQQDFYNIEKFLSIDGISQFIQSLNSDFLFEDYSMKEYYHFLDNSIYIVKENFDYLIKIYPHWFISSYPDVAIWSTFGQGNYHLTPEIKHKINAIKNKSVHEEFLQVLGEFYGENSGNENYINQNDLRIIVNLFKSNNELECVGIDS
jgi:hypothetical protein